MTNSPDDELDTWSRARQNDGVAFGALFDLHHDRVYHRALGLMGTTHDAEDVALAAFFELWRRRRSVQLVDGSVLPWLLVTVVNVSRNSRRSVSRYQRLLRSLPREVEISGPDAEDVEARGRLATSLRQLSPVDASLFVLTVLEGLSVAEAAATLGLKPATARVRLHRARGRLRQELHDLNPTVRLSVEGATS